MITEQLLYSDKAEKAVLGAMIVEPQHCCQPALDHLKACDFVVAWNGRLFTLLARMWEKNKPIDVITVAEAIKRSGSVSDSEALGTLTDALTGFVARSSISGYVSEVKAFSVAREMQSVGMRLVQTAQAGDLEDIPLEIETCTKRLDILTAGTESHVHSGEQSWEDYYQKISSPADETGEMLCTGYGHFDDAVRVKGGQVIVIGAVQKQGKTALGLNIATRWWEQGIGGCALSLEMRKDDLKTMAMANVSGVDRGEIEGQTLTPNQLKHFRRAVDQAKKWPWSIYDKPSLNLRELRAIARDEKRKGGRFLEIDYFQLMEAENQLRRADKRHLELEEIMRGIKCIAMETELAILLLCQLNAKDVEKKEDGRPSLGDLRGTGAIAQDADAIMLLYEPKPGERTTIDGFPCRSISADITNRRGRSRCIKWYFDGAHARFIEPK